MNLDECYGNTIINYSFERMQKWPHSKCYTLTLDEGNVSGKITQVECTFS